MPQAGVWSLDEVAAEAARRFPERPALVLGTDATDVLRYGELHDRAGHVAAGLRRRGVGPGDVVASVVPGGAEWVVLAVAVDRVGATFAPVSTALAAPERAAAVAAVRPRLVVGDPGFVDGLPLRVAVEVLSPGGRGAELAAEDGPALDAGSVPRGDEQPTLVCFTSGTTGGPKAAAFGPSQVRAVQLIDLGPDAGTRWDGGGPMLASTHLAHVGMALKLPWYLRLGSTLHVLPRWRADDALRLVARHRIATLGVVAPQLALMLRSPLMDELDLACVTTIVAGGAASPAALIREARDRFGAAYSVRWSSTESGGVGLATWPNADDEEALHSAGRPRPGVEARVSGPGDDPVADGDVGELQLRSGAVMRGYVGNASATADALTADGWLRTGDLARRTPAGAFVLAGRRTDMYLRGGHNVFPSEVEAVLAEHPGVVDVAVAPRPDDVMGDIGVAVVVAADPTQPPSLEDLRSFAVDRLARHKLPEGVEVVDHLPLTAGQKVDRTALRRLVAHDPVEGTTDGR
jgi:acyl-CoA synthetase (AMP-forming)/AMP-acid ligase II